MTIRSRGGRAWLLPGCPPDGAGGSGPAAVPGYPNAERFDILASGPHSNTDPASPRFGSDSVRLFGTIYLAPDVGPVSGILRYQFLAGASVLEERRYDFALAGVTPGP